SPLHHDEARRQAGFASLQHSECDGVCVDMFPIGALALVPGVLGAFGGGGACRSRDRQTTSEPNLEAS
ncbi:MAG TPA: hypothetical protein VK926_10055, partial [Gaiellaceae bacterium]|nr:hypothetical protein [Gaiellaceae bacterium]